MKKQSAKAPDTSDNRLADKYAGKDLPDSEKDRKEMEQEETTIDLPDVKDIPGQEHIHVPRFGEYGDTTISSKDEEGGNLFEEEEDTFNESNVSKTERKLLQKAAVQTPGDEDEAAVRAAALDRTDEEGIPLEESNLVKDRFGEDLDLPEAEEVTDEDETAEDDEAEDI
ncbi:hypothetical protein [Pinibacter soli]|uniref:Uncharacterized protein n=1 Tax=Pinibacter soli TaxID=3044211 RepID=A0ABT6RDF9_9BACT|nr:hypothetical protein [Pinibacter soli]MDI3320436.1 hypothetical protein [Pinibacter soli]